MAKRKPAATTKQVRAALSALKKAGLYSGDARSAKGGWRQRKLIKEYADVISGKAQAVKVGRKAAKQFGENYRAKGSRVVVKVQKSERVRYAPKRGELRSTREEYGVKYTRIVATKKIMSPEDIPTPPPGKNYLFNLPNTRGSMNAAALAEFLAKYKAKLGEKGLRSLSDAIEIYEFDEVDA